jgi:rhodanese-related sulfurtransferase
MANKTRQRTGGSRSASQRRGAPAQTGNRNRLYLAVAGGAVAVVAALIVAVVVLGGPGSASTASPAAGDTIVQGQGGHWTNVTPDRLAQMLQTKDFTLLNVKTPYIGEIDGTDLYIPYDQLTTRASQLPSTKNAKILVYCRSGAESAVAAQTLLNLGYTNVWNLDGGMNAWQASGRVLANLNRT